MMKLPKNRLEAFSDGVMAIIVTIMVLNIPLPSTFGLAEIERLLASILVFFASFFIAGLFWLQHYRAWSRVEEITSRTGWRNLLFLFCLALLPLFTEWVIDNYGQVVPAVGYTIVYVLVNVSYQFMFVSMFDDEARARFRRHRAVSWWQVLLLILIVAGVLSIFFPRIAVVLLIGLPLAGSLSNLLFDPPRGEMDREEFLAQQR